MTEVSPMLPSSSLFEALSESSILIENDAPKYTILAASPAYIVMIGIAKDNLVGKGMFEAFPANSNDPSDTGSNDVKASFDMVRLHKKSHQLPVQRYDVADEDGQLVERYWKAINKPVFASDGEVAYIIHTAEDITHQVKAGAKEKEHLELKRAYKEVEESQQRFYSLANSITQLAWIADEKGWIYWYNDRWYEYTGTTLEEMQGWGWEKVHHPDHIERVVSFVKDAWHKDKAWELVFPLRGHDGEYRWFLTRSVPVENEAGQVIQWIGTNTDIDDQKQAEVLLEQRVHERTQELALRNQELEQFTHVSHHDLQEPLRKIVMFTDMVKEEAAQKLSEASMVRLQKVSDAAVRMSTALRDVLDFASLNKEEAFVEVDLNEVIAGVLSDLELVITEKKAMIVSDALPTIKGVPIQIYQLLYNLVNNALKFSKPGEAPQVTITCNEVTASQMKEHTVLEEGKQYYYITVQDKGIGFSQDQADKIFNMFQRLHSRDKYAGTGIGLALVKKVVSNHGGRIWATSKGDGGATFNVLLPAY